MFRLLVTGTRHDVDPEYVWMPLWQMVHKHEALVIVHGDCPTGVDTAAQQWVDLPGQQWNTGVKGRGGAKEVERLVIAERHPAEWERYQKWAGPLRNQKMVSAGADACFAWPADDSRGTYDCMARAYRADIPVWSWNIHHLGLCHRLTNVEGDNLVAKFLKDKAVAR